MVHLLYLILTLIGLVSTDITVLESDVFVKQQTGIRLQDFKQFMFMVNSTDSITVEVQMIRVSAVDRRSDAIIGEFLIAYNRTVTNDDMAFPSKVELTPWSEIPLTVGTYYLKVVPLANIGFEFLIRFCYGHCADICPFNVEIGGCCSGFGGCEIINGTGYCNCDTAGGDIDQYIIMGNDCSILQEQPWIGWLYIASLSIVFCCLITFHTCAYLFLSSHSHCCEGAIKKALEDIRYKQESSSSDSDNDKTPLNM